MIKGRKPLASPSDIYAEIHQIREIEHMKIYEISFLEYQSAQENTGEKKLSN
tara:strand:+ start:276 stop:431 length:156 start_codon:yes stop_codon:yes gene_type:complete